MLHPSVISEAQVAGPASFEEQVPSVAMAGAGYHWARIGAVSASQATLQDPNGQNTSLMSISALSSLVSGEFAAIKLKAPLGGPGLL